MPHTGRIVIRNASIMTVATTLQRIISFAYFSLIARKLGADSTGVYVFALSTAQLFSIALDIGFSNFVVRETARDIEKGWQYVAQAFAAKVILTLGSMAIVLGMVFSIGVPVRPLFLAIAFTSVAIESFQVLIYAYLRGRQLISYEAIALMIGQAITTTAGLAVLWTSHSVSLLLGAVLAGNVFHAIYSYCLLRYWSGHWLVPRWNTATVRTMIVLSLPFALAAIFSKILSNADTFLLGTFTNTTIVGYYSIPYKLTYAFQFLPLAVIATLYPAMSSLFKEDRVQLSHLLTESIRALLIIAGAIAFGIIALAPTLIIPVYGTSYASAIPVVEVMPLLILFLFVEYPIGAMLNGSDLQKAQTTYLGLAMVIDALLNVILIPIFGMWGAVIAAFTAHSALLLLGLRKAQQVTTVHWKQIGSIAVRVIAVGLVMVAVVGWAHLPIVPEGLMGAVIYIIGIAVARLVRWDDVVRFVRAFLPHNV